MFCENTREGKDVLTALVSRCSSKQLQGLDSLCAGRSLSEIATDFILGHGQPRARGKKVLLPSLSVQQEIARS